MGSDAGVFAGGQYDEDDREADQIWESIDNFMDERRRVSDGEKGVRWWVHGPGAAVLCGAGVDACVWACDFLCR
jgi:hypothetical protein